VIETQSDRDTEHGETVREVHGAVQGVDNPRWGGGHEVVFRGTGRVGLFADEGVGWVVLGDGRVDEVFDVC
jgi:hypothetical protein